MKSGKTITARIHFYTGACLVGDPTVYANVDGFVVWVVPGESVDFMQA